MADSSNCDKLSELLTDTIVDNNDVQSKVKGESKKKRKQKAEAAKTKKARPNYFIGIQITKPEILGKILAIQNHITATDSRFTKALVSITTTHLTLAVMHLKDKECVARASEILANNRDEVLDILGPTNLEISIENLGNFGDKVLFVNITPGEDLNKLTELSNFLVECCNEFGSKNQKAFKPHITILKLSKLYGQGKNKVKKIPAYLYNELNQLSFGCETASNLQLLSMMKKKHPSGYYRSEYTLNFGEDCSEDSDWSLQHWSECIAVACITAALYIPTTNPLNRFSDYISEQTVKAGVKSYEKFHILKRATDSDRIREKLVNLKKVVSNEGTKQQIREGLGMT